MTSLIRWGKELARQALQSLYLKYKSFNPTQWKVAILRQIATGAKLIDDRHHDIYILLNGCACRIF
ncbi:hypothetical protein QUA21_12820 [Microcoleus sp. Pol1B3]|uniref:hypothetical protein n=1 Tax=unclassified Microcoleus TaxID=2642155 RepID=UPI002FD67113